MVKPPSSHDFWLGLSKVQALLQNEGLDLEFPELQDWGVWNFITSSSWEEPCLWVPPMSRVVSPASWPQTCSLSPKECYEPWHISIAELHSFEMLLGKRRSDCGEEGACNKKFPKDTALHTLTFPEIGHKFDSLEKPQRSHAAQEEHRQKSRRDILKYGFWGCVCPAHSGVQGMAVPCPGCPWAARAAGRNGAAAPQESTEWAGSCLQHCREPIRDLRLQAARPQHLPEWLLRSQPAVGSPAAMWPRPAQLSSAGQMGPVPAGAAFPQQHSLEGIPRALGSQGQGEKPNQHQLLLHRFSSFTEPPLSLGGYSVPQHDFPGLWAVHFWLGNQNICETCSLLKTWQTA